MSYQSMPPPSASAANGLDRLFPRAMGRIKKDKNTQMELVFGLSLFVWLTALVLVSLVASVFTGRPAAVTMLWRRYRAMTQGRWPQRQPASSTPRADAAQSTGASMPTGVQDVRWREVAPASEAADDARHP